MQVSFKHITRHKATRLALDLTSDFVHFLWIVSWLAFNLVTLRTEFRYGTPTSDQMVNPSVIIFGSTLFFLLIDLT